MDWSECPFTGNQDDDETILRVILGIKKICEGILDLENPTGSWVNELEIPDEYANILEKKWNSSHKQMYEFAEMAKIMIVGNYGDIWEYTERLQKEYDRRYKREAADEAE